MLVSIESMFHKIIFFDRTLIKLAHLVCDKLSLHRGHFPLGFRMFVNWTKQWVAIDRKYPMKYIIQIFIIVLVNSGFSTNDETYIPFEVS